MGNNLAKTAERWGNFAETKDQRYEWFNIPFWYKRINQEITGDQDLHWADYALEKYFSGRSPVTRCLSLGCGTGQMERIFAERNAFLTCDAFDISEQSIAIAKELAFKGGIRNISYQIADVNKLSLPQNSYQLALIHMAMHHINDLEQVTEALHSGLTNDGVLIFLEYIGPNHFQFSQEQKEITNHVLHLLPKKFRHLTTNQQNQPERRRLLNRDLNWYLQRSLDKIKDRDLMNTIRRRIKTFAKNDDGAENLKAEVIFPTLHDVTTIDPSEAIRSSEILNVLSIHFDILEKRDLGGNIIQFLLDGIAHNFAEENDTEAAQILYMIFNIENSLINTGVLESDFAFVIAKPKK